MTPNTEDTVSDETQAKPTLGLHRLKIVGESASARDVSLYLDGEQVRGCHRFSLSGDANGTNGSRFLRLELSLLVAGADVEGIASLEADCESLRDRMRRTALPEPAPTDAEGAE